MPQKYTHCIDCGEPKTTYSQQLSPRCNACSGKQKRGEGEYYTHCIDCGEEKPLGSSRRSPRCRECAYDALRDGEFFDICQECGEPKKRTKNTLCWSCASKKRWDDSGGRLVTYSQCQGCGQEKADTVSELCHSCSTKQTWDMQRDRIRILYDTCQECGRPKTRNDRELCLSCAGIKRMTELMGNEDRDYPIGFCDTLKERIRKRDHRKCVLCGKTEKENGRRLDVHHIDDDKHNLDEHNLISLCLVCHGRMRWNREFWQQFLPLHFRQLKPDWQRKVVVTAEKGGLSMAV